MRARSLFALFICIIICLFPTKGQNFNNSKIYANLKGLINPSFSASLIKVVGDSAYVYLPWKKIKLMSLSTGKMLSEIKIPPVAADIGRNFFVTDNGIDIISVKWDKGRLTVSKQLLTHDMVLSDHGKSLTILTERESGYAHARIKEKENHYEIAFRIGCGIDSKDNFFQLITIDKKFNPIDNFTFDGKKEIMIHLLQPEEGYSNNIAYQLRLNYKEPEHMSNIIVFSDSKGRIKKAHSDRLNNYINFTMANDSAGKFYGYCLNITSTAENILHASCDKFEIDTAYSSVKIIKEELLSKNFESKRLIDVVMQSIIDTGRIRLLIYPITGSNYVTSWHPEHTFIRSVSYYDLRRDSVTATYSFPFKMALGLNPYVGSSVFMGEAGQHTYVGYSDNPESNVDMNFSDRVNYSPDFYKINATGHVSRNSLYDVKKEDFYKGFIIANSNFKSKNGDLYVMFLAQSIGSMAIIKFSALD